MPNDLAGMALVACPGFPAESAAYRTDPHVELGETCVRLVQLSSTLAFKRRPVHEGKHDDSLFEAGVDELLCEVG